MAQRSSHNNFASKGRAAPRGPGPRFGGLEYQALEPITGSSRATKRRVGRSRGSRGARRPRAAVTHEQRPPWTSRRRARTQGPARLAPRRRLGPPTRTRVVYIPPKPTAPHRWTPRAPASDNRAARAASATAASVRRRGLQESNPLNQSFVITLAWSVFDPVNSRLADGEQGRPIEMAQFSEGPYAAASRPIRAVFSRRPVISRPLDSTAGPGHPRRAQVRELAPWRLGKSSAWTWSQVLSVDLYPNLPRRSPSDPYGSLGGVDASDLRAGGKCRLGGHFKGRARIPSEG